VVSIVGTDEVDLNRNHISWVSPLGRALMKSAAGDSVILQAPGGTEYLTCLRHETVRSIRKYGQYYCPIARPIFFWFNGRGGTSHSNHKCP